MHEHWPLLPGVNRLTDLPMPPLPLMRIDQFEEKYGTGTPTMTHFINQSINQTINSLCCMSV
jgi:hypothetical protein